MKITVIHPDLKRSQIRLSERKTTKVTTLFKHLPLGATIKGLGKKVDVGKDCLLHEIFNHGDVIEAMYTPKRARVLRLSRRVNESPDPCMITLDTTDQRAKMPCGHSITPQALFDYCWHELEKGSSKITCPYVTESNGDRCEYRWRSDVIIRYASMNTTEQMVFRKRLDINRIKQQELESSNVLPDDVIISHLHNSPKLPHYGNVLKCRACPKCWSIIEHVSGCLSMTCQYPSCNFRFCFRCLDEYSNEYNHNSCRVAPLQFLDTNVKPC
ncbi:uncharacterized protein LOC117338306 [Pecten maximus]|uniref:uncharacterized protein LOC117338306 n=1 Tax=Pecten maximus TaxID=6579 RepID=UPI00145848FC|nr:uncharacterized protein LOC117338306 [Pecten maximus]